jgi:CheY-like chemotaxis protein
LPRSLQDDAQAMSGMERPAGGGKESILVVEDDLNVQATVVAILSELGYRVTKADDGESALKILKAGEKFDLLFTDVIMPGALNGPDLARQARQLDPALAVLFTSGYTQNAIGQSELLDPAMRLLMKPYRRDQLAAYVRETLEES